jgi:hypothetical protein
MANPVIPAPGDEMESTVAQFIGWLSADIPALRNVEIPTLADSWDRFKKRSAAERLQNMLNRVPVPIDTETRD